MNPLPPDRALNLLIWAVVWVVLLGWGTITAAWRRLPSFADVIGFLRCSLLSRWALLAFGVWLGWHLFVRTTY